jgi:hypothetical protein
VLESRQEQRLPSLRFFAISSVLGDDVNLLGDKIDTIKKNMETLIDASKEVGLEVNTKKTKYNMLYICIYVCVAVSSPECRAKL